MTFTSNLALQYSVNLGYPIAWGGGEEWNEGRTMGLVDEAESIILVCMLDGGVNN